VVLMLMFLAGCLADPETDDAVVEPVGPGAVELVAASFSPSVLLGQPETYGVGGEPSVAVAGDGTIYVSAPIIPLLDAYDPLGECCGQGRVWRSDDGGQSFTLLNDADGRLTEEGRGNGDTDLAVDAKGRVHFVDLGGGIPYLSSVDRGSTWEHHGVLNEEDRPVDRQWIDAHGDGLVVATWAAQDGSPRGITATVSRDGGATWSAPTDIVDGMIQLGPVDIAPDGLHVLQPYVRSSDRGLHVMVSGDGAASWSDVDTGYRLPRADDVVIEGVSVANRWSPTVIFPVAATDAGGTAYLVWSEYEPDASTRIAWMRSLDGGLEWEAPRYLTGVETSAVLPWLVAGDAGRIAVAYLRSDMDMDPNMGPHEWKLEVATVLDAHTQPWIEVGTAGEGPVHFGAVCPHGGGCTTRYVPLYGDRTLLDFFEAALTPAGDLVVVWTQTDTEDGRNPQVRFAAQAAGTRLLG